LGKEAMIPQVIAGILIASAIGILAWRSGALTPGGAIGAALTGGLIFGLGGLSWAALLLMFFISSSILSKAFEDRKSALSEKFSKGSQRDLAQTLANGGLGAALAVVHALLPDQLWPWLAFIGAMAAVNADTWATEIGVLNPYPPRMITIGKQVDQGTSGAVSLLGYLAVLGGSVLIGITAAASQTAGAWDVILAAVAAGFAGSTLDSLLGATVQAIYFCPTCKKDTERHPLHICGTTTIPQRGWRWLDNDWVNFIASLTGAASAVWVGMLFG
jgi:uncharacterized protein (TIGR00297 family)